MYHYFKNIITDEDKKKTEQYANQAKRKDAENKSGNFEDYLKSLKMTLTVFVNDKTKIARMAQMTQKTNQFNLTTKRYTENQLLSFIENPGYDLIAIGVSDKFGDNGITGLAIINKINEIAEIETFLMSCRIIGRNIETVFIDFMINTVECKELKASYIGTAKNTQTEEFYEKTGFDLIETKGNVKFYNLLKQYYKKTNISYIKINYGE